MISGSTALSQSNSAADSLSYINHLVTGATAQGLYEITIPPHFLNDDMVSDLRNTYGYRVYQKPNSFMGTHQDYVISWSGPPRVAGVDFTIEWWIKVTSWTAPTGHPRPFSLGSFPAPNAVSIESSGDHFYWWTNGSYPVDASGLSLATNTWHHMAVTRDNGALSIYINGTREATGTFNDAIPSLSNVLYIGAEPSGGGVDSVVNGKMTNFRWNSSVKYTGNSFVVPTSPLTSDSNTKLLLKATGAGSLTTDSSSYARTVTNNGSASWSSDSPFVSGGGSIDFAGTKYFTVPASTDWDL